MRRLAILVSVVVLVFPSLAQDCDTRHISITAVGKDLRPVMSLAAANVEIKFDKQRLKVLSLQRIPSGRILFLLDQSGSMEGQYPRGVKPPLEFGTAGILLHAIPENRPVGIISFATKVEVVSDFDMPRVEAIRRFEAIRPPKDPRTSLLDALLAAARMLSPAQPGDTIVVITDGGDNQSKESEDQLVKTLAAANIRVMILLLSDFAPLTDEEVRGPSYMKTLAQKTGGAMLVPNDTSDKRAPEQARQMAAVLASWIDGGYDAEVKFPPLAKKPAKVQVKLIGMPPKNHLVSFGYSQWVRSCGEIVEAPDTALK